MAQEKEQIAEIEHQRARAYSPSSMISSAALKLPNVCCVILGMLYDEPACVSESVSVSVIGVVGVSSTLRTHLQIFRVDGGGRVADHLFEDCQINSVADTVRW
jgi:hypothetical protein